MTPSSARRSSGFTLVELMVSLVVGAVVIAGALALLTSNQRVFQSSSADRGVQETARAALEELTTSLRVAGYGLEPTFAFDFGLMSNISMDRAPTGQVASVAGYACSSAVTCRDSTTGPDELVVHSRDPGFMRTLAEAPATGGGNLVLAGPLNAPLHRGQLLQVACYSGSMLWAFVTVGAEVPVSTAAKVTVSLAAGSGYAFGAQNQVLADTCFLAVAPQGSAPNTVASSAKVFKVNRSRYYIQSFDQAGNAVTWDQAGSRPYLMLDHGLLDTGGQPILDVIAADVEDLQLSYVFPRAAVTQAGATVGTALASSASGIDLSAASQPLYTDSATAQTRTTHHPANIGAVQVSVVVRTVDPDTRPLSDLDRTLPAAGNRDALVGPDAYRRVLFQTSAVPPNLDVRAPYFPAYSASATDGLNVGGG